MKIRKTDETFEGRTVYQSGKRKFYIDDSENFVEIVVDKQKELKNQEKENITVSAVSKDGDIVIDEISHAVRELSDAQLIGCHEYVVPDDDSIYYAIVIWQWWRNKWNMNTMIKLNQKQMNTLLNTMIDMSWLNSEGEL